MVCTGLVVLRIRFVIVKHTQIFVIDIIFTCYFGTKAVDEKTHNCASHACMHVCVAALIQFYDMFSVKLGYCLHIMNQARPLVELFECSINKNMLTIYE